MYDVLSPIGEPAVKAAAVSPRLPDLNGKTVGEISNGRFRVDFTFPLLRDILRQKYPGINIIPYTEFPTQHVEGSGAELLERAKTTAGIARQKDCDAVIIGNGF